MKMFLEEHTWSEVVGHLNSQTVAVIPLGGAAKEHGAHLPLGNDCNLAMELARRLTDPDLLTLPCVNYFYYPAFAAYPGSLSLRQNTAHGLMMNICEAIASAGVCFIYILNTGLSTMRVLEAVQAHLADKDVTMAYTDITRIGEPVESEIAQQPAGSHADELETSMMMYPRSRDCEN
jgi:creatinine amidohydrolase